ncbi:hypothetical protein HHL10_23605 [Azohydromonas sp. G-1-1-14]|uniref:MAPEG family protein n=2 Tax=Azohydromonas caseinilytica TaxID=2728836 RepID=A0A848FID3_9BURK|nr:MAPEG family protein [Azohydromonas caseinilytica]NML17960.1 hypothetical protein [Azohydromonas caseinilytica]
MFTLTAVVWVWMYALRLPYILRSRIELQSVATSETLHAALPARLNLPSHNLKNLFELPVVFYALCILLFVTGRVDDFYLYGAWVFVVLRVLHSLVHCTVNRVSWRFAAYFLSSLVLWMMVGRFGFQAFFQVPLAL